MESVKKVRTNSGSIEVRDDVEGEDSDSTDEQDSENSGSESSIDPTMVRIPFVNGYRLPKV